MTTGGKIIQQHPVKCLKGADSGVQIGCGEVLGCMKGSLWDRQMCIVQSSASGNKIKGKTEELESNCSRLNEENTHKKMSEGRKCIIAVCIWRPQMSPVCAGGIRNELLYWSKSIIMWRPALKRFIHRSIMRTFKHHKYSFCRKYVWLQYITLLHFMTVVVCWSVTNFNYSTLYTVLQFSPVALSLQCRPDFHQRVTFSFFF